MSIRLTTTTEEFGIYLNYVRRLGFEETPDYDFLRELFSKVMKNNNDIDDGVYAWNLLHGEYSFFFALWRGTNILEGGKGWEASMVSHLEYFPPVLLTVNSLS